MPQQALGTSRRRRGRGGEQRSVQFLNDFSALRGPQQHRPSLLERDTRSGSTQAFKQGNIALEHVRELSPCVGERRVIFSRWVRSCLLSKVQAFLRLLTTFSGVTGHGIHPSFKAGAHPTLSHRTPVNQTDGAGMLAGGGGRGCAVLYRAGGKIGFTHRPLLAGGGARRAK
jgi:hypothetical protein